MNSGRKKKFSFPLVFDPFRLALAVERSLIGIVLGGLIFALAAAAVGFAIFENTYSVNFQLLGQDKQWAADGAGLTKPFEALILNDDTLVEAAANVSVLSSAGAAMDPPLTAHEISFMTKIDTREGGELFDLTMTTTFGPDETVALAKAWSQAIADHTAELRQEDARTKIAEYAVQLKENEEAVNRLDEEMRAQNTTGGGLDSEERVKQLSDQVKSLNTQLTEAKINLDAARDEVELYERESKGPSFLRNLIILRQQDLVKYRLNYTERHPLVQTAIADIGILTQQLNKAEAGEEFSLDGLSAEGEIHGDAEFQKLAVVAKSKLKSLESRVTSYEAQLKSANAELLELRKVEVMTGDQRETLADRINTTSMIRQRIKEAEFVANNPVPQVSVFLAGPTLEKVETSSSLKKVLLAAIAGLMLGCGLFALRTMMIELCGDRLRTPVQVALATGIYPTLRYPRKDDKGASVVREFWLTDLATDLARHRRFLFPVIDAVPGEKAFWEELIETVAQDGCQVVYMDFSYQPLTLSFHGQALPFYNPMAQVQASCAHPFLTHSTNLLDALNQLPTQAVVIGRWGAPPVAWINQIRSFFDLVFVVTSAQSASRSEVEKNCRIYQQVLGDVHDTVLVEEKPPGVLLGLVQSLEDSFVGSQQAEEQSGYHLPMDGGVTVYTPTSHQLESRADAGQGNRNRYPADPGVHVR